MRVIYTIGHAARSIDDFLAMLLGHCVETVIDVRGFPVSRLYPRFNKDELAVELATEGIRYEWLRDLSGPHADAGALPTNGSQPNLFRIYAEYMRTPEFESALRHLISRARDGNAAILCSEALSTHCHRRLIADALAAHGWTVIHILDTEHTEPHEMSALARLEDGHLTYRTLSGRMHQGLRN
jgi:uncharacterized protein (DUF488 family)